MTRQAFLAQMPDPLSFRPLGIFFSFRPSRFFSFSRCSCPFARSVPLHGCLFSSDEASFLSSSISSASLPLQKSRAIALGGLSTLTDSWSHIAGRRVHVLPCSGPSRQTNRKQTFMPLYLKREALTHRRSSRDKARVSAWEAGVTRCARVFCRTHTHPLAPRCGFVSVFHRIGGCCRQVPPGSWKLVLETFSAASRILFYTFAVLQAGGMLIK